MEDQAFTLLKESLRDLKSDIRDVKKDIYEYRKANDFLVTKLRIRLTKIIVIASMSGMLGGLITDSKAKITPFFKKQKIEIEPKINKEKQK